MRIVLFIIKMNIPERYIADCNIKGVFFQLAVFKTANLYLCLWIELLCYSSCQTVKLNSRYSCVAARYHSDKVTDTTGRLKQAAAVHTHIRKFSIHFFDDNRRGIKGCHCGFSCGFKFIISQQFSDFLIVSVVRLKDLCHTTPTCVFGKYLLFFGSSITIFGFKLFQSAYCGKVVLKLYSSFSLSE